MDAISTSGGFESEDGGDGAGNPGADFSALLGIGSKPESVIIKGQNFKQMKDLAGDVRSYVDDLETINNVNINVQDNTPEVQLHFEKDFIGRNNYTLGDLAAALSTFGREYSSGATFRQGTESYDIMIKFSEEDPLANGNPEKTIEDLRRLEVTSSAGAVMEMEELANIIFS